MMVLAVLIVLDVVSWRKATLGEETMQSECRGMVESGGATVVWSSGAGSKIKARE